MRQQPNPTKPLPVQWAAGPERELPAVVRAHLVELRKEASRRGAAPNEGGLWPSLSLVIHAESMADEFASLRYGTYIVEWFNPLIGAIERLESGFFTGESLSKHEAEYIAQHCRAHTLACMTRRQWLEQVFFKYGYYGYGAVVGFDLPHILSRLATRASAIQPPRPQMVRQDGTVFLYCQRCHQQRKHQLQQEEDGTLSCVCTACHTKVPSRLERNQDGRVVKVARGATGYAGGWKLVFNEYAVKGRGGQWRESAWRPPILIKPITPKAAMYRWGTFADWKEKTKDFYPGHFLDLRTLGYALSSDEENDGSLWYFGKLFGAEVLRNASSRTGEPVDDANLGNALNGAEAALALYRAELDEYNKHGLEVLPDRIYSGASLGKAYLQKMGLSSPPPLDTSETRYSVDDLLGFGMSSYYSGRSEGQFVRVAAPVVYVDVHGMYPAVCILQNLWEYMQADKVQVTEATQETIQLLARIRWEDLHSRETWRALPVLCLVEPEGDVLPLRADFRDHRQSGQRLSRRIAIAEIAGSNQPMWWTLAECINSALQTGKPPHILCALKLTPLGAKPLRPISIRGGTAIDPNREDFFRSLVDARDALGKSDPKLADALKIVANSSSYGIWAEANEQDGERAVTAYSTERRQAIIPHGEQPGRYYAPPFAAFITSAARLLLALLEHEVTSRGGASAFCDTDSLAIIASAKGGVLQYPDHEGKSQAVRVLTWAQVDEALQALEQLDPYGSGKPLIKLERENYQDRDPAKPRIDLHAYVTAAKRYFLFVPPDRIVKASRHTLGIVQPPRDENGNPITDWIEQFGRHVIAGLPFKPPWAEQPVEFQLEISRPEILKSFRGIRSKAHVRTCNKWLDHYLGGIKPFNTVAVLAKSEDRFAMMPLESNELKGVPVIAAMGPAEDRRWVIKSSGRPVPVLPPQESIRRRQGMTDDGLARELEECHRQRRAVIQEIQHQGGLYTTYKTFAELLADYQGQHESKARDLYGKDAYRETKGLLVHPRVRITGVLFTGKETVLQEEVQRGIVSAQEAEQDRFLIPPEHDETVELLIDVLRLLTKAEMKRLSIGPTKADQIKSGSPAKLPDASGLLRKLVDYLQVHYPDEVGRREGSDALRAFIAGSKQLMQDWQNLQPRLGHMPTKELVKIAGCSRREAIRIKKGNVQPSNERLRKIASAM